VRRRRGGGVELGRETARIVALRIHHDQTHEVNQRLDVRVATNCPVLAVRAPPAPDVAVIYIVDTTLSWAEDYCE